MSKKNEEKNVVVFFVFFVFFLGGGGARVAVKSLCPIFLHEAYCCVEIRLHNEFGRVWLCRS